MSGDGTLQVGVCIKSLAGQELLKGSEEMVNQWVTDCQPNWLLVTTLRLGDGSPSLQARSRAPSFPSLETT